MPGYDPNDPSDPNVCLSHTVRINEHAEPLGEIENFVEIESYGENAAYNSATETTPVCCWGGDIIYVNQNAKGYNTGTCDKVVTGDHVNHTAVLDGFIIQEGTTNGVYCYFGDPNIANCVVMANGGDGL